MDIEHSNAGEPSALQGGITAIERRTRWAVWAPLIPILILTLVLRMGYIPLNIYPADANFYVRWGNNALHNGLFSIYQDNTVNYGPIAVLTLAGAAELVNGQGLPFRNGDVSTTIALKVAPLVADILTIIAVYVWLRARRYLRWVIPLLLAIVPGLLFTSVGWGQLDAMVAFFVVAALLLLNRSHPKAAWVFFALGVLTKIQGVILFPLLLVLTIRRFNVRTSVTSIALGLFVGIAFTIPFALGSGFRNALNPYLDAAGNRNTMLYANAQNLWYTLTPQTPGNWQLPLSQIPGDATKILGSFSYNAVAYLLFGLFTLLITVAAWRNAHQNYEFVWASALYYGFFMLPTRVHERYMLYAVVLLIIAIAQNRRLWLSAIGASFTFSYNIIHLLFASWLGWFLWSENIATAVAVLNIGLLIDVTHTAIFSDRTVTSPPGHLLKYARRIEAVAFRCASIVSIGIVIFIGLTLIHDAMAYYPTAKFLNDHVASNSSLTSENLEVTRFAQVGSADAATWNWTLTSKVEERTVNQWMNAGSHYLVVSEDHEKSIDFSTRLQKLSDQGATLLYQTNGMLGLVPKQAVFWTFKPQHVTDTIFDNSLRLIGYNISDQGSTLTLHWNVVKPTPVAYHFFIHIVDPSTGALLGQVDGQLGEAPHFTNIWKPNELVFETITLPEAVLKASTTPYRVELGLYEFETGKRAAITDSSGKSLGDFLAFPLEYPLE